MCYQFYFEIYGLQEQIGVTDFSMNGKAKERTRLAPLGTKIGTIGCVQR